MGFTLMFLFIGAGQKYNLPPGALEAVCYVESRHNVNAIHHHDGKGTSLGICQIKLNSARLVGFKGSEKELMKPAVNIEMSARYLKHQLIRYNGELSKALIAYNRGSAGYLTSTNYSRRVILRMHVNDVACRGN